MEGLVHQWQPPPAAAPAPMQHPTYAEGTGTTTAQQPAPAEEDILANDVLVDKPASDVQEDEEEAYEEADEEMADDEDEDEVKEEDDDEDSEPPNIETLQLKDLKRNWWVTKPFKNNPELRKQVRAKFGNELKSLNRPRPLHQKLHPGEKRALTPGSDKPEPSKMQRISSRMSTGGRGPGGEALAPAAAAALDSSLGNGGGRGRGRGRGRGGRGRGIKLNSRDSNSDKEGGSDDSPPDVHSAPPPGSRVGVPNNTSKGRALVLRGAGYEVHQMASLGGFEVFVQLPAARLEGLQVQAGEQCLEVRYHTRDAGRVQQCKLVLCVPGVVTGVRQVLCTAEGRLYVQLSSD